ncbi:Cruciform DNA-recognizing protein 1 [Teratosphaeria destructans]|uniref:Cruciform DNA-recognizing protein 1 n=1 Tax=Teratosphaeria destructans TaxID=418781 RepID=A0A9W7SZY3_9PEZI|nr:Cruciform DNA-recognizing protein 1 [Teratosphaeria destructans]
MSLSHHHGLSTDLPEREQDANLSGTYPARPGAQDVPPTGATEWNALMSDSVKGSLDSEADGVGGTQSVTEQVQRGAHTMTEQLPTAQQAADSLRNGVSSLISGISKLAVGATGVAQDATVHTGSEKARDVDELAMNIPGAFDSETTDAEDFQAVKNSLPSQEQVKSQLPDMDAARRNITGPDRPLAEQVSSQLPDMETARRNVTGSDRPLTEQIQGQLPDMETARRNVTGSDRPLTEQIQGQLPDMEAARRNVTGSERPLTEQVRGSARYAADSVMPNTQPPRRDPSINSVGVNSTTNDLAGQIPLERDNMPPRVAHSQMQAGCAAPLDCPAYDSAGLQGVPDVVTESQRQAGKAPEAAANPEAVQEKRRMERELRREIPAEPPSSSNTIPDQAASGMSYAAGAATGSVVMAGSAVADAGYAASDRAADGANYAAEAATGGLAAAGSAVADATGYARQRTAETTGTDPVSILPESTQRSIDPEMATSNSRAVPPMVSESQRAAGVGPEAAANPTAVQEKTQMERELTHEISPAQPTSTNRSITGALTGGLASAGAAATDATAYAREKTHDLTGTDPVSVLPESAQRQIEPNVSSENIRPTHAGPAPGIPRDTVESSAAPDVSYEHRPKTLPKSEIAAREDERAAQGVGMAGGLHSGVQNGVVGAGSTPSRALDLQTGIHNGVVGSGSTPSQDPDLQTGIHNGVVGAGSTPSQDLDLHSGIKNGVIGAGSREPADAPAEQTHSLTDARGIAAQVVSAPVEHISVGHVDLSAGVRNSVTGAGGRHE